ncbi:MAG: hypothetical protein ACLTZY_02880 [Alistipes indistinctus]
MRGGGIDGALGVVPCVATREPRTTARCSRFLNRLDRAQDCRRQAAGDGAGVAENGCRKAVRAPDAAWRLPSRRRALGPARAGVLCQEERVAEANGSPTDSDRAGYPQLIWEVQVMKPGLSAEAEWRIRSTYARIAAPTARRGPVVSDIASGAGADSPADAREAGAEGLPGWMPCRCRPGRYGRARCSPALCAAGRWCFACSPGCYGRQYLLPAAPCAGALVVSICAVCGSLRLSAGEVFILKAAPRGLLPRCRCSGQFEDAEVLAGSVLYQLLAG